MKRLLKTASFLSLVAIPFGAHAEGPADIANFSPRIKLQSRYSLMDSYRKNQMDLITATARFGMNYRYKNTFGVIEMQAGSPSDGFQNTSGSSTPPTDNGQQSLFVVRRANVGLDIYKSDPATISFLVGRDHQTASIVYAPDALYQVFATNLDNVGATQGQDGVNLKYAGKFEFGKLGAILSYANNLAVSKQSTNSTWFGASSIAVGDNSFGAAPKSQSRAAQVIVSGDISAGDGVIEARALYGSQPNVVTNVASSTSYNSRDVTNTEASIGYNYKDASLRGGLWFQSVTLGQTQNSSGTFTTNDIKYVNGAVNDSATINTIGVGVTGNSKLWGMSGLLADGDALTYAFGYQNANGQLVNGGGGTTGVPAFANATLTTDIYNVGIGYQQGNFTLELNYAAANANCEIYPGDNGVVNKKDANILYLVGTLLVI